MSSVNSVSQQPVSVEYIFDHDAFRMKWGKKPTVEQENYRKYLVQEILPRISEVQQTIVSGCASMNESVKFEDKVQGAKGFMLNIGQLGGKLGSFQMEITFKMADALVCPYAAPQSPALPSEINLGAFKPHKFFFDEVGDDVDADIALARTALREAWLLCNGLRQTIFERCAVDPHMVTEIMCKVTAALGQMLYYARTRRVFEQALGGSEVVRGVWGFDVSPVHSPPVDGENLKRRRLDAAPVGLERTMVCVGFWVYLI